ncbi:hypothetical protein MBANPS3_003035 [Mucor bainieri]
MLILGGVFCKESGASLIKMHFYSLLTLILALTALLVNQQVSAAAVANPEACTDAAYKIFEKLLDFGCRANTKAEKCKANFDASIKHLNSELDKCGRSDYVTLCRIQPTGFLFTYSCHSLTESTKLTKAECETRASRDYTTLGSNKFVFKAENARCMNSINFDCGSLCK